MVYPRKDARAIYGSYASGSRSVGGNRVTGYFFAYRASTGQPAPYILQIPPVRLARGRQTYLLPQPLHVDLRGIEPDLYRVHLVQDFWTDDDNPNLNECLAGIFLGRRRTRREWEMPERWPIECRSLKVLGTVDTRNGRYAYTPRHGA